MSTLKQIEERKAALHRELNDLQQEEALARQQYESDREDAVGTLVDDALKLLGHEELSVVNVIEGTSIDLEALEVYGPRPGYHQVAVQVFSARERKGYVDTADKVEWRNASYRDSEMVVVQFLIPREDLAGSLKAIEEL